MRWRRYWTFRTIEAVDSDARDVSVDGSRSCSGRTSIRTVGPGVSWPVFDAGSIRSNIRVQEAREQQAATAYERTILVALQEVEDALIAYAKEQVHHKALADAAEANRQALELANQLHTQGRTNFLSVLDAERSLYASEDALVQSDRHALNGYDRSLRGPRRGLGKHGADVLRSFQST